ncbi:D-glycerate 3-kinase [Nitrospirillum amazonense]|uniref:D-glycerate 3-kinase n=1 Tax=Nitrospirillum amazonense TaxID=28077 RepID=A0A560FFI7_9PROT|nr:kinase [Nitrospirillum amazonense]TWB20366.1 D-glycerate 3-kinase [Nitrospirillum amazonense]
MTASLDLVEGLLRRRLDAVPRRPFILGICGAQGSGKSTLADGLAQRLAASGLRIAVLSLDDLYLTKEERQDLARAVHPLLATRGVPGTHDVGLGLAVLDGLGMPGRTLLPRFDKAVDSRAAEGVWVEGPVDVVLFEGWCVGAVPQAAADLGPPVNELERDRDAGGEWRRYVNAALAGDYQRLFGRLDALVLLAAPDFAVVRGWRIQQEEGLRAKLRAAGKPTDGTMTDDQVSRFIQFYERLTRHILAEMPGRADLTLRLDAARQVV